MLAENLKKVSELNKRGFIKSESFNAIVDALKESYLATSGYSFSGKQSTTNVKSKSKGYFFFSAEENLPFRSIFGTGEFLDFNDPPIINAINIADYGVSFNLYTNILPYNVADTYGLCRTIGFYEPVLLFVSDEEHFPQIGMPCGPDKNPEQWGISASSFGLICISTSGTDSDTENNVWCIRTPDPVGIIGIIFESDVPAYNKSSDLLGSGQIVVQYRNSENILVNAVGPDGEQLVLPVYNASSSSVFKVGTLVKCICVQGVGLVIVDITNLVYGRAADNIKHFNSGNVNVYTGTPGNEALDSQQTPYVAFNHLSEVVKDEWCFLTATGDKNIPYYIVQNEYNGMILGKTNDIVTAPDDVLGDKINIWGGQPGAEISFSTNVNARLKNIFGAIPRSSWVIATFLGPDATVPNSGNNHGGWYINATQHGRHFTAVVTPGQQNQSTQQCAIDTKIKVQLVTGDQVTNFGTPPYLIVDAYVLYAPVVDNQMVEVEWNGDIFVITKSELDNGFVATVVFDIEKGGVGYVSFFRSAKPGGSYIDINNDAIQVKSPLGKVLTGKKVRVFGNRDGFEVGSGEC